MMKKLLLILLNAFIFSLFGISYGLKDDFSTMFDIAETNQFEVQKVGVNGTIIDPRIIITSYEYPINVGGTVKINEKTYYVLEVASAPDYFGKKYPIKLLYLDKPINNKIRIMPLLRQMKILESDINIILAGAISTNDPISNNKIDFDFIPGALNKTLKELNSLDQRSAIYDAQDQGAGIFINKNGLIFIGLAAFEGDNKNIVLLDEYLNSWIDHQRLLWALKSVEKPHPNSTATTTTKITDASTYNKNLVAPIGKIIAENGVLINCDWVLIASKVTDPPVDYWHTPDGNYIKIDFQQNVGVEGAINIDKQPFRLLYLSEPYFNCNPSAYVRAQWSSFVKKDKLVDLKGFRNNLIHIKDIADLQGNLRFGNLFILKNPSDDNYSKGIYIKDKVFDYLCVGLIVKAYDNTPKNVSYLHPEECAFMDKLILKQALGKLEKLDQPKKLPSNYFDSRSNLNTHASPTATAISSSSSNSAHLSDQFDTLNPLKEKWNVIIYANDEEYQSVNRIFEFMRLLSHSASKDNVRILIQHKIPLRMLDSFTYEEIPLRKEFKNSQVIDDYRGICRFEINGSNQLIGPDNIAQLRSRVKIHSVDARHLDDDMGSKDTLKDFLKWTNQFPADHTMLIVWAHGMGWRMISNENNKMTASDFNQALKNGLTNKKFDVLLFGSCRTAMLEALYEVKDHTKYVSASQQMTPIDLVTAYGRIISTICNLNKVYNLKDFSKTVFNSYVDGLNNYIQDYKMLVGDEPDRAGGWTPAQGYTMSLIDTSKLERFKVLIDEFATELCKQSNQFKSDLKIVKPAVRTYGNADDAFADLWGYADAISKITSASYDLKQIANQIKSALDLGDDQLILDNKISADEPVQNSHGLSISIQNANEFNKNEEATYRNLQLAKPKNARKTWMDWLKVAP